MQCKSNLREVGLVALHIKRISVSPYLNVGIPIDSSTNLTSPLKLVLLFLYCLFQAITVTEYKTARQRGFASVCCR